MKKLTALLLAILMLFTLSACGKGDGNTTIDMNDMAQDLLTGLEFDDNLYSITPETAAGMYGLPDTAKSSVYCSSGATAEELAIFQLASEKDAKDFLTEAKRHISDRTADFAGYMPEQVEKLNSALVLQKGKYVIICVGKDITKAKDIINSYF